jgi:hypothetical protein
MWFDIIRPHFDNETYVPEREREREISRERERLRDKAGFISARSRLHFGDIDGFISA